VGLAGIFLTSSHQNYLLWILIFYIGFFAISQGAVIWVYIGEVFPNRVRAEGQSIGSSSHWVMNALVSWIFPVMFARSHGLPFAVFAGFMVLQFFVVLFVYPETKGYSLEEMQHRLGID
jgi:MFS family permease